MGSRPDRRVSAVDDAAVAGTASFIVSSAPRWRAASPNDLSWRCWDDELVVFDQRTGDTHHLGTLSGSVLLALIEAGSPLAAASLMHDLLDAAEEHQGPDLALAIDNALRCLEGAGLVIPDA